MSNTLIHDETTIENKSVPTTPLRASPNDHGQHCPTNMGGATIEPGCATHQFGMQ